MGLGQLVLIAIGLVAVAVGIFRIRVTLATIRRLDQTEANLDRYDAWRGKRSELDAGGPTGADEMRAVMRQRVIIWGGVIVVGVMLVLAGLVFA